MASSEFEKQTSPVKLDIAGKDVHVGLRDSDESVLTNDIDVVRTAEKQKEEARISGYQRKSFDQRMVQKAIGDDKNRLKHVYTMAQVTRKGGKYKVEEQDLFLSIVKILL